MDTITQKARRETLGAAPLSRFELLDILRGEIAVAGSQRAWARSAKVSVAYVSDVLRGRRDPGPSILKPLGYTRQETYSVAYIPGDG